MLKIKTASKHKHVIHKSLLKNNLKKSTKRRKLLATGPDNRVSSGNPFSGFAPDQNNDSGFSLGQQWVSEDVSQAEDDR